MASLLADPLSRLGFSLRDRFSCSPSAVAPASEACFLARLDRPLSLASERVVALAFFE